MEELLNSLQRKTIFLEDEDGISFLIHIASSTKQILTKNNVEIISKIIHIIFNNLYSSDCSVYLQILEESDKVPYIVIKNYKIFLSDKWSFQLLILNSIKSANFLYTNETNMYGDFIVEIISYILRCIDIVNPHSLNLLKTLQYVLSKRGDVLTSSTSLEILEYMNIVAISPIHGFKQYAQGISKICLNYLNNDNKQKLCNFNLLPVRSIEMYDILTLIPKIYFKSNLEEIINKVLNSFNKNIENKDGGILYRKIISYYSFEQWRDSIWPLLISSLVSIETDREFFQSLIKYWIPYNVGQYTIKFYDFIKDEPVALAIKGYCLLETVRKGQALTSSLTTDITNIINNIETVDIGLKIVSTYFKKSLCPGSFEVNVVMDYLHANLRQILEEDQVKRFRFFFSQLFFYAHCDLSKSSENLPFYQETLKRVYKYCSACLRTEFFEVGVQIMKIILDILKGSYENLVLPYKLEKKYFYGNNENNLYKQLKAQSLWQFDSEELYYKLEHCFMDNGSHSSILTNFIIVHHNASKIVTLRKMKDLLHNVLKRASLKNTEIVMNYSKILLQQKSCENNEFITEIMNLLQDNISRMESKSAEESMFIIVLYFGIINNALNLEYTLEKFDDLIKKCLTLISSHIDSSTVKESYATLKVFESFIIMVLNCIKHNLEKLWPKMDKIYIISVLIKIIQRSNMKKPVTSSGDVLKYIASKMDEIDDDINLKINLLNKTLKSINSDPSLDLKIRRNPESRLVIYALCSSENNTQKLFLNWSMNGLLDIISSEVSSDIAVARALHCIEILIADNLLHNHTLPYVPDIIVHCVELFGRSCWIIRNADLQLAKALIDRFFGVSLGSSNRPKTIEDLFNLFPQIMPYFFKILSSDPLDERATMVFQFFSESQIKQKTPAFLNYFQLLFMDIIKRYRNYYGKLAVRSFVALCCVRDITAVVYDLTIYVKSNFYQMEKNIFSNLLFLLQELFEKFKYSSESLNRRKLFRCIRDFKMFLSNFNTPLFDFLLVKSKDLHIIIQNITKKNYSNFYDRIWLHNNLPFLVINTKSSSLYTVIDKLLTESIPECFKVKVLSILVSRFEQNDFSCSDLKYILNILFKNALSKEGSEYLSICYFKVIFLFYQRVDKFKPQMELVSQSNNLYKSMVAVIYLSSGNNINQLFCKSAIEVLLNSMGFNEDIDNDIMSSLVFFKVSRLDENLFLQIVGILFYYSMYCSTYLEAYNFISLNTNKTFSSMLHALKVFLSPDILTTYLNDQNQIIQFFDDVNLFIKTGYRHEISNGYYSIDVDNLMPKLFLKKLLIYVKRKYKS